MRACLFLGLILAASIAAAPLQAQPKKGKEKPAATSRMMLTNLQTEVDTSRYGDAMKFAQFLALAHESLRAFNSDVAILVDEEAYRELGGADAPDVLDHEIRLRNLPAKTSMNLLLRQALKQLPTKSAFVVRAGKVEIVPYTHTAKEYLLNQTFHVDFSERPLDQALEELSDLTGVSIVIDARAKQKAQTAVTARFHDDVALQDAVRMLTDMAELKIVYLVTGIYVTTPEHAKLMQKELKGLYEPKAPPAPFGMPGIGDGPPPDPYFDPPQSPLAPPLPPMRGGKRLEPAA